MNCKRFFCLGILLLAAAAGVQAESYTYTLINIPGSPSAYATGINNSGQIVGEYAPPNTSIGHGFVDSSGTITDVFFPGSQSTEAFGINNSGQVVGQYQTTTGVWYGFEYSSGTFTQLAYPGAAYTPSNWNQ